jgi:hypothetical protein
MADRAEVDLGCDATRAHVSHALRERRRQVRRSHQAGERQLWTDRCEDRARLQRVAVGQLHAGCGAVLRHNLRDPHVRPDVCAGGTSYVGDGRRQRAGTALYRDAAACRHRVGRKALQQHRASAC